MTNSELYRNAELTEREKRYLRHLTREASTVEALATFCRYVGWYDTDTNKPKNRPLATSSHDSSNSPRLIIFGIN